MKITHTIMTLLAAGFLSHSAFGDNGQIALSVTPDGHGGSHFQYIQTVGTDMSVALSTNSGGVGTANANAQAPTPMADDGQVRFVAGTDQHGQPRTAYIPLTSHFGPAQQ